MKRNCAYTGKESECTDKVLSQDFSGGEAHNWTNSLPATKDYKYSKADDFPTPIEAEIHRVFYQLELARWDVKYLEEKLTRLQAENNSRKAFKKSGASAKNKNKIKNKQIEASKAIHEIIEDNSAKIEAFLEKKKRSIF